MVTMIAYCGLKCDSCPIHLATFEKDKPRQQTMREAIAEQCSKHYGMNLNPEDITDCDGCRANTSPTHRLVFLNSTILLRLLVFL